MFSRCDLDLRYLTLNEYMYTRVNILETCIAYRYRVHVRDTGTQCHVRTCIHNCNVYRVHVCYYMYAIANCDTPWISWYRWTPILARLPRAHNVPTYQIWVKSNNPRRSYSDLKLIIWRPPAILNLSGSWFSKFRGHRAMLNYWRFGKFSPALCGTVTLTFDPLTLNFCSTSGVTCSNSV